MLGRVQARLRRGNGALHRQCRRRASVPGAARLLVGPASPSRWGSHWRRAHGSTAAGRQAAGSTQDRRAGALEGCRERERREAGAAGRRGQAAESYGQRGVRVAEASGRGRWFSSGADRGSCSARLSGGQARTNRRTVVHWAA